MRKVAGVLFVLVAGCGGPKETMERAITATASDSASIAAYEDSLMGNLFSGGASVVTIYGDTLASFDGWSIDIEGTPWYEIDHYSRNRIPFLSIKRSEGHENVARATWSRRFTLRLPLMDSTERVILQGLCLVDGKNDRLVVATIGTGGDSFYRPARKAWRFNVNREALEEISTAGVTCSHVHPDGD